MADYNKLYFEEKLKNELRGIRRHGAEHDAGAQEFSEALGRHLQGEKSTSEAIRLAAAEHPASYKAYVGSLLNSARR